MSQVLRLTEPTRESLAAASREPQYALEDSRLPKSP
jgi:hypothetical protein